MNTSIFSIAYREHKNMWYVTGFIPIVGTVTECGETKEEALENFHKIAFNGKSMTGG